MSDADIAVMLKMPRTPSRRELLWLKEGKKCYWCGKPTRLVQELDWDQATTDHVLPRYKGGDDDESNLVSACRLCNNRRSHEDAKGLPEGALLGTYLPPSSGAQSPKGKYIALSADDKKAINEGSYAKPVGHKSVEDVLREQRDQALTALAMLRKEQKHWEATVQNLDAQLKGMTMRKLAKMWLIAWLQK